MKIGDVLYEAQDRVATITLNRPERFNAISATMPDDLETAVFHADNDPSIHVIILTGAGRGFCGGYDLKQFAETPGENPRRPPIQNGQDHRHQGEKAGEEDVGRAAPTDCRVVPADWGILRIPDADGKY